MLTLEPAHEDLEAPRLLWQGPAFAAALLEVGCPLAVDVRVVERRGGQVDHFGPGDDEGPEAVVEEGGGGFGKV